MYREINGICIDDFSYDKVCLNCAYWDLKSKGGGMACSIGNGETGPEDTCPSFAALTSMDGDMYSYLQKRQKMEIWDAHR